MTGNVKFIIQEPELQINFSLILQQIREQFLQQALGKTIEQMEIAAVDSELARYVPRQAFAQLASRGLRGELLFAVPVLLQQNPYLLGYYRLLLGFSQKAFYSSEFGLTSFKSMEEKGVLTAKNQAQLIPLCQALINCAVQLLNGIGIEKLSLELLDDLTLLTLGPQLRGGANVRKGNLGIIKVFEAIHSIVKDYAIFTSKQKIELLNSAHRHVFIEFAPDPDIIIREEMRDGSFRNIIAIEIKAGTDFSNIHNRIGEAEKSHQKARQQGFVECWTVVNVDRINIEMAQRESPSTNRFYRISKLCAQTGREFNDFKARMISLTGIPD